MEYLTDMSCAQCKWDKTCGGTPEDALLRLRTGWLDFCAARETSAVGIFFAGAGVGLLGGGGRVFAVSSEEESSSATGLVLGATWVFSSPARWDGRRDVAGVGTGVGLAARDVGAGGCDGGGAAGRKWSRPVRRHKSSRTWGMKVYVAGGLSPYWRRRR